MKGELKAMTEVDEDKVGSFRYDVAAPHPSGKRNNRCVAFRGDP